MAGGRKIGRRRTFRGKRKGGIRRGMSAGVKALKIAKSLQRKIEWKHVDYSITSDSIDTIGNTYPLLEGVSKEVGDTNRIGDQINIGRISLHGSITLTSTAPINVGTLYRVSLVKGIRENATIPVMGANSSASLGVWDNTGSMPLVNARKYVPNIRNTKVLYDKVYSINPGSNVQKRFDLDINAKGKVFYTLGGDNLVKDGGYYLMIASNNGSVNAAVTFTARSTFNDA